MTVVLHVPDLLDQVVLLSVLAGVFALIDGISRFRGSAVLAIVEIVVAALLLASIFFDFGVDIPLITLAIVLEVVVIICAIFHRRMRRGTIVVTVLAVVFTSALLLVLLGWLTIPFLHS